jgi:hypothetical protein
MAIVESRLRDGVLKVGTAPELDLSCQVTNVRYATAYSDDGDAVETLCGDKIAAGEKADGATLQGTFIQDWTAGSTSIISYLMAHDLQEVPYTYTPNPAGSTYAGSLRLKLPGELLGGDVNTRLTSDFEWVVTSWPPTITGGTAATGATAGIPGTWTPSGSTPPANAAAATGVTASPATAWTVGQYVQGSTAGTAGEMHWTGTSWVSGKA